MKKKRERKRKGKRGCYNENENDRQIHQYEGGEGREEMTSRTEEAKRMTARRWLSSFYTTMREGLGIERMNSKTKEAKRMTVQHWMITVLTRSHYTHMKVLAPKQFQCVAWGKQNKAAA